MIPTRCTKELCWRRPRWPQKSFRRCRDARERPYLHEYSSNLHSDCCIRRTFVVPTRKASVLTPKLPGFPDKCLQRDRKTVFGCSTKALCLLAQSKARKVNLSRSRVCLQISRSLGCLFLSLSRKRTGQDKGCGGTHPGGLEVQ